MRARFRVDARREAVGRVTCSAAGKTVAEKIVSVELSAVGGTLWDDLPDGTLELCGLTEEAAAALVLGQDYWVDVTPVRGHE